MDSLWGRVSTFVVAVAFLYAAIRIHRARPAAAKYVGTGLAFLAGLGMLSTIVGGWMTSLGNTLAGVGVAGLVITAAIVAVDVAMDKKPDKPAFWAAFLLPIFIVIGMGGMSGLASQINDGGQRVSSTINGAGR